MEHSDTAFDCILCHCVGCNFQKKAPELALSLFPANGFAAESRATGLATASVAKNRGEFPDQADPVWNALALQAFEAEPLTPNAITVIGLARTGDSRRDLMQKAFDLSRRQQLATGWLITDSGLRNDITAILKYYDTILRTSSFAESVIIPVLANALAGEDSVQPFAKSISQNPPWARQFWRQVAATPESLDNAVDLRQLLYKPNEWHGHFQDSILIKALTDSYRFEQAERLYTLLLQSKQSGNIIRNGDFTADPKFPPLDWLVVSTGEYGASIEQDQLNLSAVHNSGGIFARQLVKLPPALLSLQIEFAQDVKKNDRLNLGLSCAENTPDKPTAQRIRLREKSVSKMINNRKSRCEFYWLDISGRAADAGEGFDIGIKSISMNTVPEP